MIRKLRVFLFLVLSVSICAHVFGQSIPDEARRHFDRGMAAVEMAKSPEDLNAAINEFKQATVLAPSWADAFYNLGKVQESAAKYEEAIVSLRQYLRLSPNAGDADEVKSLVNKLEFKTELEKGLQSIYEIMTSDKYQKKQVEHKKLSGYDGGYPLGSFRTLSGKLEVRNVLGPSSNAYHPEQHPRIEKEWEPVKVNGRSYEYEYSHYMDMSNDYVVRYDIQVKGEIISIDPPRIKEIVEFSVTWGAPIEGNRRPWSVSDNWGGSSEYVFELREKSANVNVNPSATNVNDATVNAKGSDINTKDKIANAPLHRAVSSGNVETAELLIAKGADKSVQKEVVKMSPLHLAAMTGRKVEVERLIAEGADVNAKDQFGQTPLYIIAAMVGRMEIAELLIAKGADVNGKSEGGTPLHHANKEMAELLTAKGADVNAKDKFARTPLHSAAMLGRKEVAELLITKGADIDSEDRVGDTPLHMAAMIGHKETVELLIAKGSDVNAKDKLGRTPRQVAEINDHKDVVEMLLKYGAK